jgi:GNAT superfamily N-acetyltransferase
MIPATKADLPAITAFLRAHLPTAMFALSNLDRFGMAGGHPRAMSFWMQRQGDALRDVASVTDAGLIFPNCPQQPWGALRQALSGRQIIGIMGAADQVTGLEAALDMTHATGLRSIEPHYALTLSDLVIPDVAGFSLRPLSDGPRDLVIGWRRAYLLETLPLPGEDTDATAIKDIDSYIAADSHRLLYHGGQPVAMTGFNARLPDAVQIGGVYTPPDQRGQGLARRAVALHLAEARAAGATQAMLFAANTGAARAYEAVGFQQIGQFGIILYAQPQVLHG